MNTIYMDPNNSSEVYTSLTVQLLLDIADCYPSPDHERDVVEILHRFRHEGISFITKTLPALGKAVDTALHTEAPLYLPAFEKKPASVIPHFLGWLLEYVFTDQGYVRSDACVPAIKHIRQLAYIFYKLELPYDDKTEQSVLQSFIRTEEELAGESPWAPEVLPVIEHAKALLTRALAGFNPRDIVPRHGPGSVATGENTAEKSAFSRLYVNLERVYPFTDYFTLGATHICDGYDWIQGLEVMEVATAKVVLVPKDSRGPRLISCEPLEVQWIQQGISQALYKYLENNKYTCGHVNFLDQSINRMLALEGSRTQKWVTLDMKDASDRVSLRLVKELFADTPLLEALLATRSGETRLPDGTLVQLAKFAPMGSALCFPVEALCFWALSTSALYLHRYGPRHVPGSAWRYNHAAWRRALASVYVYGDDIICRAKDYRTIMQYLPLVELKFNEGKCCTAGFFRESCGMDAFKGIDVTPIKVKTQWRHHPSEHSATELSSYVALGNAMCGNGYRRFASSIREMVDARYGRANIPYVAHSSYQYGVCVALELPDLPVFMRRAGRPGDVAFCPLTRVPGPALIAWCDPYVIPEVINRFRGVKSRFHDTLYRREFKGFVIKAKALKPLDDDWREVLRVLTCGFSGSNVRMLAYARRPSLKRAWMPAV